MEEKGLKETLQQVTQERQARALIITLPHVTYKTYIED